MRNEQTDKKSISVVSDWQERSSKKQVGFNLALLTAFAIAFLCTTLLFFWSKRQTHVIIVEDNIKYIQVASRQEADLVEKALEDGVVLVSNLADRYVNMITLLPDKSVKERLELLRDHNLFDRIGHVTTDGYDTTLEGDADVHDRDYFINGMNGETGYDFLPTSRVTGKPCAVFYSPIVYNDEIIGVMIGFYESPRLN